MTLYVPEHEPVDKGDEERTRLPGHFLAGLKHLKNKIVIIGGDFIDRDQHRIPFSVETKAPVPGAFIHAQIVAQLIDGKEIEEISKVSEVLLVFVISVFVFLISSEGFLFGIELFYHLLFVIVFVCLGIILFWGERKIVLPTSTLFLGWIVGVIGGTHYEKFASIITTSLLWMLWMENGRSEK
jgi:CHASE2 domain-containing sensor protein